MPCSKYDLGNLDSDSNSHAGPDLIWPMALRPSSRLFYTVLLLHALAIFSVVMSDLPVFVPFLLYILIACSCLQWIHRYQRLPLYSVFSSKDGVRIVARIKDESLIMSNVRCIYCSPWAIIWQVQFPQNRRTQYCCWLRDSCSTDAFPTLVVISRYLLNP